MAREQSKGTCTYCGAEVSKGGAGRHLAACRERRAVIENADASGGTPETLVHLRVQDDAGGPFWLDLEVRGSAELKAVDRYLRAIWLECCGHLSHFSAGGWDRKIGMQRKVEDVFRPGVTVLHIYDYGTSSETLLRTVEVRTGVPTTPKPIALMARNRMPDEECAECERPATRLCLECTMEQEYGMLCDEHARTHPHRDYGEPLPLVNSPRLGMCGYTGPADPPY